MIPQPHDLIDPEVLFSFPQQTNQGRVMRQHGNERVHSLPGVALQVALFLLSVVVSFLLNSPGQALAAEQMVEMPPMPGQAYHSPDQNGTKGISPELPLEIKQIDEQIQRDASILKGGGVPTSPDVETVVENQERQTADTQSVAANSAKQGSAPPTQPPLDKDADQSGHGGLIVFLIAAVGATLFLLRKYFRR